MRSLRLDFLHPHARPGWPAWLLLAVGLAVAGWVLWQERHLDQAIAAESARQIRLAPALARILARTPAGGAQTDTLSANEQLALPWSDLFSRLEKVQSKRIALLALEADGRKAEATLTAEARSLKDMLAYIESLRQEAGFSAVTLSSHMLREEDPELPYRFVLRLRWRT
jgi:Tfp pilus assembly protein PilN